MNTVFIPKCDIKTPPEVKRAVVIVLQEDVVDIVISGNPKIAKEAHRRMEASLKGMLSISNAMRLEIAIPLRAAFGAAQTMRINTKDGDIVSHENHEKLRIAVDAVFEHCKPEPETKMNKFRKKPIVVEAVQLTTSMFDSPHPNPEHLVDVMYDPIERCAYVRTLEGTMEAKLGDWIIKGVNGELYPCKPDIFEKTYEPCD